MKNNNVMTTTKDQTSALLTDTLKRIREDQLLADKVKITADYNNACEELQNCRNSVKHVIETNRGGVKGMHGFIGERAQVHIANAKALVNGETAIYNLLDDNGPVDYTRGNIPIQQKACKSGGNLGLDHVLSHSDKYPTFTHEGGIYQIPKDLYREYRKLKDMNPELAGRLRKEEYRLWKFIQQYSIDNPDIKIEPMVVSYDEIQAGTIEKTLDRVSKHHKDVEEQRMEKAIRDNAPCVKEFAKVCLISASVEGAVDAVLTAADKKSEGKRLRDYDSSDYKDIGKQAVKGFGKGAIRGSVVYVTTNFTSIPAPIATSTVTAAFDITSKAIKYNKGEITKEELIHSSLWSIADGSVSALGSIVGGKYIIKILPGILKGNSVVGGLIGNATAMLLWGLVKRKIKESQMKSE